MTADIIRHPHSAERVDATIRSTVRALMEGRGLSKEDLAPQLGISPASLYRKLNDHNATSFKAGELALVADALNVTIDQLYSGLGGTFTPPENDGSDSDGGNDSTFCLEGRDSNLVELRPRGREANDNATPSRLPNAA